MRKRLADAVAGPRLCLLVGCPHRVGAPQPQPTTTASVAPIIARQVDDLLSPDSPPRARWQPVRDRRAGILHRRCAFGESASDLTMRHPVATDGGHRVDRQQRQVIVVEMAGVYRADFDSREPLLTHAAPWNPCRGFVHGHHEVREACLQASATHLGRSRRTSCCGPTRATTGPATMPSLPHTMRPSRSRCVRRSTATTCRAWRIEGAQPH